MTYEQALTYLDSFTNYERVHAPKAMRAIELTRMQRLCQRVGDPHRQFRTLLVAGTNGKGSICAMLYGMLQETLLRVGLYTSPHLDDLRERIRVSLPEDRTGRLRPHGDWIPKAEFARLVSLLQPLLESERAHPSGEPTYFEVLTAIALAYFRLRRVDIAIVEVGLGGRVDATNVIDAEVTVFGPIDVDHADVLGHDPILIARDKAGIIKPRQTVVSSPQAAGVEEVLRVMSEAQGCPLVLCGRDITVHCQEQTRTGLQITVAGLRGIYESLEVPLLGRHQAENAAVAIGAFEALSDEPVPQTLVAQGLARVSWPGRIELVQEQPAVLMDGAHNAAAMRVLCNTVAELYPSHAVYVLLGLSADKPVEAIGAILGGIATTVVCSQSQHPRALDSRQLAKRLGPWCSRVQAIRDPADGLTYLMNTVGAEGVIVVTGSLFFVGPLREAFRRADAQQQRPSLAYG